MRVGVLVAPTVSLLCWDLSRRGALVGQLEAKYLATYALSLLESAIVWGTLLYAASRRHGWVRTVAAVWFVIALSFVVATQARFHDRYNVYFNVDLAVWMKNPRDLFGLDWQTELTRQLVAMAPVTAVALGWVCLARRRLRPSRRAAQIALGLMPAVVVLSLFIPTQRHKYQASLPDTLLLHSGGGLIRARLGLTKKSTEVRARRRTPPPLAQLEPKAPAPRNVLLVILESVRADVTCRDAGPGCQVTEATHRVLPRRHLLRQLRALDSSTAVSHAVLWTGLGSAAPRDQVHDAPSIFDLAKVAGFRTALWSSQHEMFGNMWLWQADLELDRLVSATRLDPLADFYVGVPERSLIERVTRDQQGLGEPFLAVVHLINTHHDYYVDPTGPLPFQPEGSKDVPERPHIFNRYRNSVYQQDQVLARWLESFRQTDPGKRTVILYTSDHAEAFREHNQLGHGASLYTEEVHVPGFVDAPEGTLSAAERQALTDKQDAFVTHADLFPTILDLMGVLDDPRIAEHVARLPGRSFLRPELAREPLPITNCAAVWSCASESWGVLQGSRRLHARAGDAAFSCFDLAVDEAEQHPLPPGGCADLEAIAFQVFGRLPEKQPKK